MAYQSEIILLTSPAPTNGTDTEDLSSGGNIYVGQNVNVVDEGTTNASTPIYCNGYGSAIIDGFVYGLSAITFAGAVGDTTSIQIGTIGDVSNFGDSNSAVEVQTGAYNIENAGTIQAVYNAVNLDFNGFADTAGSGGGTFENTGVIAASSGAAIFVGDNSGSDYDVIQNDGTISGSIRSLGESNLTIVNAGTIEYNGPLAGQSVISSSGVTGLYNSGTIFGSVSLTNNADLVIDSGKIDGGVEFSGTIVVTSTGEISSSQDAEVGVFNYALFATSNYDIKNAGQIVASGLDGAGILLFSGGGSIVNTGSISSNAEDAIYDQSGAGDDGFIYNTGTISGPGPAAGVFDAIHEIGGHAETIFNTGLIEGGSDGADGSAIYGDTSTVVTLRNSGEIDGQVSLNAAGSYIDNSGHIAGWITLAGETSGTADFLNTANGVVSADSGMNALTIASGPFLIFNAGEILAAASGVGAAALMLDVSGGAAGVVHNAGTIEGATDGVYDVATSGTAYLYNFGTISALEGNSVYDGQGTTGHSVQLFNNGTIGAGSLSYVTIYASSLDKEDLHNHGVIEGEVDLTATGSSIQNWGTISGSVVFGAEDASLINDGVIDGNVTFAGNANLFNGTLGDVTGVITGVGINNVYWAGLDNESFNFVGALYETVRGGAGNDNFLFSVSSLTAATSILGGTGADTVQFSNAGTIAASAFSHVQGIAAITLANGTNNLTIGNAVATSANGGLLTINGGTGADTINISGVATATNHVTVYGGGGADVINGGVAVDTFGYHAVADSTGPTYDTITGVNFAHDYFDVSAAAGSILGVSAAVTTGTLASGANFNADLAAAIGTAQLGASDVVLFTPNAGNLAGDTFLIIDSNHAAGYQANADLVINVTGATGTLAATNFV